MKLVKSDLSVAKVVFDSFDERVGPTIVLFESGIGVI
jgi:hypothetical protein